MMILYPEYYNDEQYPENYNDDHISWILQRISTQRSRYNLHNFEYKSNWVQTRIIMLLEPRNALEQFEVSEVVQTKQEVGAM